MYDDQWRVDAAAARLAILHYFDLAYHADATGDTDRSNLMQVLALHISETQYHILRDRLLDGTIPSPQLGEDQWHHFLDMAERDFISIHTTTCVHRKERSESP